MSEVAENTEVLEAPVKAIPQTGEVVVYHPRPGEFRNRRVEFPAICMGESLREPGTVDLLIFYDREDSHIQENVREWTEESGTLGYTRVQQDSGAERQMVISLSMRLTSLQAEVEMLKKAVFGSHEMPEGECVLGILDEYEDRISVVEGGVQHAERDIAALKKPATAKAKPKAAKAAAPPQE